MKTDKQDKIDKKEKSNPTAEWGKFMSGVHRERIAIFKNKK